MTDKERLDRLDATVFGNGQDGLLVKVSKVELITKIILGINVPILIAVVVQVLSQMRS